MTEFPYTYTTAELVSGTVKVIGKTFPRETLGEDTVVIRPDYIGICRADIKEIIGSRDIPTDRGPLFGHEFVGSVAFAGIQSGFRKGDLVTFNPNITPVRTTGFAEYVFVHGSSEQLDQAVVRVPEAGILDSIWMPEPFACIVHATKKLLELAKLRSLDGKRVGIIGAGCSGIMFAMYAKHLGASVIVFNRGESRLNFARDQKLLTEEEICTLVGVECHRDAFDVVIVVPTIVTSELLQNAANIATSEGILHIYGGTRAGDRFPKTQVDIDTIRRHEQLELVEHQGKRLRITGAYGCFKEDYEESFRLHAKHSDSFSLEKLVSTEIELNEFPRFIMEVAAGTKDYPGKVVIKTNPTEPRATALNQQP
ncbi:hypothetical protein C5748_10675 [Phyllobacterium phragmitis]|uniref:Alcohol dehydrogenase-like N-terminal domain-containing protein n=1 Tax=Phyllobacterium phragmitis TaxID=2670329 RepID=A0A2S9IT43_9HYPH|nr:zinc-binding dehydrogenase [Phyllobacterium phragmitis]PRD43702.1 hypothetical protein C5748_10675 [Phyllobacterium phragmitis]